MQQRYIFSAMANSIPIRLLAEANTPFLLLLSSCRLHKWQGWCSLDSSPPLIRVLSRLTLRSHKSTLSRMCTARVATLLVTQQGLTGRCETHATNAEGRRVQQCMRSPLGRRRPRLRDKRKVESLFWLDAVGVVGVNSRFCSADDLRRTASNTLARRRDKWPGIIAPSPLRFNRYQYLIARHAVHPLDIDQCKRHCAQISRW